MKINQTLFYLLSSACLFIFSESLAQNKFTITGRVIAEDTGEPLAGANILIASTTLGTKTSADGTFKLIKLPAGNYRVTASFIGYSSKTIPVSLENADRALEISLSQTILSGPVVTVVATQARERVSPVTFSALEKQEIEARYTVQDIPEIVADLPSTTFYSEGGNGLGYNYLSIRGFDQRRISVLINGVPQNDPEDHNVYWVDFPDLTANVQAIQVQRGAGSAFYGPAAIGGSINILTNYFLPDRQIKATYGRGAFDTGKASFSYNSGLLKKKFVLFGRVSNIKTAGYRQNAWIDFKSYFFGAAAYAKRSNVRVHFYGGPIKDGLAYLGVPKNFNGDDEMRRSNFLGSREIENFNQPHLELIHEYKISPKLTLNNNAFFIRGYGFFDYDGSWGTPAYFRLTPEFGFNVQEIPGDALIRAYVDNKQVGWLPQLNWRHKSGELVAGAELRRHRSLHWGRLQEGSGLPAEVAGNNARRYYEYKGGKDIASVYLRETLRLRPDLYAVVDLQYAYKRYKLFDEQFLNTEFTVPYSFLNPRFGLNYNLSERVNLYTNLSRTTREPRLKNIYDAAEASTPADWGAVLPQFELNPDGSYNFDTPLVKPEKLTDFELGVGLRTGSVRAAANVYYMDFRDEIIKKGGLDRFGQPVTGNADHTVHQGLELSGEVQILPQLSLAGNFLASKNELKSYRVFGSGGEEMILDGNPIAGFPNSLGNLRFTYSWQGLYASLILKYVGKQYTDNFKNDENSVDAYEVLNLSMRYDLRKLGLKGLILQARVNNLLNKKYLAHGEGTDFFPAATRNGFVSVQYAL
jgi:iron complex outermembrane receptor protein